MRGRGVEMGSIRSSRVGSRVGSRLADVAIFPELKSRHVELLLVDRA